MIMGQYRRPRKMTTRTMKSRQSKFIEWLKTRQCPRCHKFELIPKNPRYDKKFRCLNCGLLGKVVRRADASIS